MTAIEQALVAAGFVLAACRVGSLWLRVKAVESRQANLAWRVSRLEEGRTRRDPGARSGAFPDPWRGGNGCD